MGGAESGGFEMGESGGEIPIPWLNTEPRADAVAACQAGLRLEAAGLKAAFDRIAGLVSWLPRSRQETSLRDIDDEEEQPDRVTVVRALAMGVLADRLRPAVLDLLAAADYASGAPAPSAAAVEAGFKALPAPGADVETWVRSLPGWPGPVAPENLEVTVEARGNLPLPAAVSQPLLLLPGDAVLLEPGPASLRLLPCRDWVRGTAGLSPEQQAAAIAELGAGAISFVTPGGTLPLPAEILPLSPGETVVLQLQERGGCFRLFAFKDDPPQADASPRPREEAG